MKSRIGKIINEELLQLSNFDKLMNNFQNNFPDEFKQKVDSISDYIKNYVKDHRFTLKFLNSCDTGFKGVRTDKFIIICSPSQMEKLGDFLYTIFHEIRHEEQMNENELNLENPLKGNLEDFEKLFQDYWKLELDADSFAKRKISELILNLNIPLDVAKSNLSLSTYVENYPSASKMIENHLRVVVNQIKNMKKLGMEYNDIADHPFIKTHLEKLEDFF